MNRKPRPASEPIINRSLGGLLSYPWSTLPADNTVTQTAATMAFVTLSLCELFRAYTVRSERMSVFQIGLFSNRYMQYAVGLSIGLLLLVVFVGPLQSIFNTQPLELEEWAVVLGLSLIPAVSEEITKFFLRRQAK
jgi:P-type Ca2+ transporter type 2C